MHGLLSPRKTPTQKWKNILGWSWVFQKFLWYESKSWNLPQQVEAVWALHSKLHMWMVSILMSDYSCPKNQLNASRPMTISFITYLGFETIGFLAKFFDILWIFGKEIQDWCYCFCSCFITRDKEYKKLKMDWTRHSPSIS